MLALTNHPFVQVESVMKTNPLVDNLCVYVASDKTHTVALLVPAKDQLEKFAGKIDPSYRTKEMEELHMCNCYMDSIL